MDKVKLYLINSSLIKDRYDQILSFVDESRREKALRYQNEKDRLLSLGAAYLLKKYLPLGEIKENSNGKPYLANGPFFNLSHSGEYIVLGVHSSKDIGVDIEQINEGKINAIKYVLNDVENSKEDTNVLFQMWTNKESIIKCLSSGLKEIKTVDALPLEGSRLINGEHYFTKSILMNGYSLSITLKEKGSFEIETNNIKTLNI